MSDRGSNVSKRNKYEHHCHFCAEGDYDHRRWIHPHNFEDTAPFDVAAFLALLDYVDNGRPQTDIPHHDAIDHKCHEYCDFGDDWDDCDDIHHGDTCDCYDCDGGAWSDDYHAYQRANEAPTVYSADADHGA